MQKDRPDETVVGSPARRPAQHGRPIQVVRDPRDYRELLTDVLGITTDASTLDVVDESNATGQTNLLGRRKRDKAWRDIQEPANRLVEEALLYPMEPVPTPADDEFPYYDARLPQTPTLHRTSDALQKLIETIADAIPTDVAQGDATLRMGGEPPLPDLPPPDFSAPLSPPPAHQDAGPEPADDTVEPVRAEDAPDAPSRPTLDVDALLPEDPDAT
jgi:hypothetical protein